jgi:hypothetical protein
VNIVCFQKKRKNYGAPDEFRGWGGMVPEKYGREMFLWGTGGTGRETMGRGVHAIRQGMTLTSTHQLPGIKLIDPVTM